MPINTGPAIRLNTTITFDQGSCAANAVTTSSAVACKGARTDMIFIPVRPSTLETGLLIDEVICDAIDTVKVRFANITAGSINPASNTYSIVAV